MEFKLAGFLEVEEVEVELVTFMEAELAALSEVEGAEVELVTLVEVELAAATFMEVSWVVPPSKSSWQLR